MFSLHPQFWLWFAVFMSLGVLATALVALLVGTLSESSGEPPRREPVRPQPHRPRPSGPHGRDGSWHPEREKVLAGAR